MESRIERVFLDAGFYAEGRQEIHVWMPDTDVIKIPLINSDIGGIEEAVEEARDRLERIRSQYNPCPMCGNRPLITVTESYLKPERVKIHIECRECRLEVSGQHGELVKKWNRLGGSE